MLLEDLPKPPELPFAAPCAKFAHGPRTLCAPPCADAVRNRGRGGGGGV